MIDPTRKIYTEQEVTKATLEYFNGDKLATDVWIKKYCLKDETNFFELTPTDMHWRIANELARIEAKYPNARSAQDIFEKLDHFRRIVPGGSPMSGIGNNMQTVSLSNCFVIGNDTDSDSYGGILKLDQEIVQLEKRRGGVGVDMSFIRPTGSPVKNSAITSTGIVPFMERYSNSTKEVAQDGRRGALMLSILVKHPDAEAFIDAKLTQGKVTGANISIKLTDEFMNCVVDGKPFVQQFPIDSDTPTHRKEINAKKLWDKITHNAWKSAEPGILYWDTLIRESVPDCYVGLGFKTISTNPCSEIGLCANDACRLLAINLYSYVINPFTDEAEFDYQLFNNDAIEAQRYMDDIVDLELEKIDAILLKIKSDPEDDFIKLYETRLWERIREKTTLGRRTGFGVTGEGDMIAAMGFTYGTDAANDFAEKVQKVLKTAAYYSSVIMAEERGAFPIYSTELERNNPFILRLKEENPALYDLMEKHGRRNIALLTIAPTGSVSILTQTTSGCEPVFLPVYKRRRKINSQEKDTRIDFTDDEGVAWSEYPVFHHHFATWLKAKGYDIDKVKAMKVEQVDELVKLSPYHKATSNDVDWVKKVEMQGRLQKHIDHSISVTVNLPKDATEEMVAKVYETGWRTGCKGLTVYRDGSRDGVLISNAEKKEKEKIEVLHDNHAPKRPKRLKADIHRFQNNNERWIAVVGLLDGRPYEIFTGKLINGLSDIGAVVKDAFTIKNKIEEADGTKKSRYDLEYVESDGTKHVATGLSHKFDPEYWNYAKLFSGVLRHSMPLVYAHQLIESLNLNDDNLNTWKNGVARVIKKYIKDGEKGKGKCPSCGSDQLEYVEGCLICKSCSWGKCG